MKRILSLAMSVLLALSASLSAAAAPLISPRKAEPPAKGTAAAVQKLAEPAPASLRWEPLDEAYVEAMTGFAARTSAGLLAQETENAMYSPASLYMALSLCAAGAKGETRREMLDLLGAQSGDLPGLSRHLFQRLYADGEYSVRKLANSVWIGRGQKLQPQFLETAAKDFYASVYQVDFAAPETGRAMTQWVSDNTGGVLAPPFDPDASWLVTLINTLYVKETWQFRFPESQTRDEPFYRADGVAVTCPFMHNEIEGANFWKGPNYRASELGTSRGRMVVVLPDAGVSPGSLLADTENLPAMLDLDREDRASYTKVVFSVPRFSFGNTFFRLQEMLAGLGMEKAFSTKADFTGMLSGANGWISAVEQGTHIAVDESGFEAAAYTAVANTGGGPPPSTRVEYMKLDRPFLFAILSNENVPLFIGIVADPTDKS